MSVIDRVEALALPLDRQPLSLAASRWRAWQIRYRTAAIASDVLCALVVCVALGSYALGGTAVVALVGIASFVGSVALTGGYSVRHVGPALREYRSIALGFAAMLGVAMVISFLQLVEMPPAPVLLGAGGIALAAALLRTAQRGVLASLRVRGLHRSRAILVAPVEHAGRIAAELDATQEGLDLVGACVPGHAVGSVLENGIEVLGSPLEARLIAEALEADVVLISAGAMPPADFRRFQWAMEATETEVVVVPDLEEVLSTRLDMQVVGGTPMMTMLRPTASQRVAKRMLDRVLGTMLLILASPVILVSMAAVRLTSPGAAIFRQIRVGRDSRPFTMLKLRTMRTDAEKIREQLQDKNEGAGPLFKMVDDPRITPIGRVLRRFSIDELPQLWNVVRGDMSLVGPRPPLPREVADYDSMAVHRLHVRPGLTGLWQVSGRSDLSWEESIKLDLRYVDNWSIRYDLQILWRTARAVLGARGAY